MACQPRFSRSPRNHLAPYTINTYGIFPLILEYTNQCVFLTAYRPVSRDMTEVERDLAQGSLSCSASSPQSSTMFYECDDNDHKLRFRDRNHAIEREIQATEPAISSAIIAQEIEDCANYTLHNGCWDSWIKEESRVQLLSS